VVVQQRDLLAFRDGGDEQVGEPDRPHVPAAPQRALNVEGAMPVLVMGGQPFAAFLRSALTRSNSAPVRVAQPSSNSMTPQVATSPASISEPKTAATAGLASRASALASARWQVRQQPLYQAPGVQVRRRGHRLHQTRAGGGLAWREGHRHPNRCGSRSPRPADAHAARPSSPAWLSHDRSSTVFPLPAGADTTVTRAGLPTRSISAGRDTTVGASAPAPPPPRPPDRPQDPRRSSSHDLPLPALVHPVPGRPRYGVRDSVCGHGILPSGADPQ